MGVDGESYVCDMESFSQPEKKNDPFRKPRQPTLLVNKEEKRMSV